MLNTLMMIFGHKKQVLKNLKIIMDAHKEVFEALKSFTCGKNKILTYLIGNHDAEVELQDCQKHLVDYFDNKINIIDLCSKGYFPISSIQIAHGHQRGKSKSI